MVHRSVAENDISQEKDMSSRSKGAHSELETREETLRQIRTAGSISISPELFEKIYLSPANKVKDDLRLTFANPTPLGLVGFCIALTPLSCDLMGWRGAGGGGAAEIGAYFWFGGALQGLAGLLEFFLGNTFPFVVFSSFGAFFLSFATTLVPFYDAAGSYGTDTAGFHASFGFLPLFMGLLCVFYLVCALRTNLFFVIIFFTISVAQGLLAAAHWQTAQGNVDLALNIEKAAGASAFVSAAAGWYLLLSHLLKSLDFPFQLPVVDLSHLIESQKQKATRNGNSYIV